MTAPRAPALSALEIAAGEVLAGGEPRPDPTLSPLVAPVMAFRPALEQVVADALARPPCTVAFSGGRDSSAVLAVAANIARRRGLPLPIPVSLRWLEVPDTEESEWQELVIRHLGLDEWCRLDIDDELDFVGPVAAECMRRHGLLWPPSSHFLVPLLRQAAGGSLLRGEGGDELFDDHHYAALLAMVTARRRPDRRAAGQAALALAPRGLRRRVLQRRHQPKHPWLTPPARATLARAWAENRAAEPVCWSTYTGWLLRDDRPARVRRWATATLATEHDVSLVDPLLEPGVVAALAADGRCAGYPGRAHAMARHFGDLLPPAVTGRRTKALFTGAYFHRHSRAFVAGWGGEGLDGTVVDGDRLRAVWEAPVPNAASFSLLQHLWLSTHSP